MKNHKSLFHIFLLVSLSLLSLNAQGWEKIFMHSTGLSKGFDVVEASDGNYVMCGEVDLPTGAIRHHTWVVKTDTSGNELWSRIYNHWAVSMDEARALIETPDGGFMIAGANLEGNAQVLRIAADGDSLWTKVYTTTGIQRIEALIANPTNSGYLLAGSLEVNPDIDESSFSVIGLDSEGNSLWSQTYGDLTALSTRGMDIMPTADGHFLVAGSFGDGQAALLKIAANGDQQWVKKHQLTPGDIGLAVQEMPNGDILLGGYSTGFAGHSPMLLRLDSDGEQINEILVDPVNLGAVSDIQATADGGYLLAGSGFSFWETVDTEKGFLRKLNSNLDTEWDVLFDDNTMQATAVRQTSDGSIIISGYKGADMLLKRIAGISTSNEDVLLENQLTAEIYPNPVVEKLIVEIPEETLSRSLVLRLFDMNGRLVKSVLIDEGIEVIDVSQLSSGIYSYVVFEEGRGLKSGALVVD